MMELNKKRVLMRLVVDAACIACVAIPVLIIFVSVKPYQRGFFCDDESLKHPHKTNTIPTWVAGFVGILLPSLSIFIIEGIKIHQTNSSLRKYIKTCYQFLMPFFFGGAISQLTVDIGKYSIGRLRPHFITVCVPDATKCSSNVGAYIEEDICTGMDKDAIEEARLSFPSGHTAVAFYCMVWLMIYLHYRFTWKRYWLIRPVLQAIAFYLAYYTGLSRISDYAHHWSDVLSGAIIGTFMAVLDAFYISNLRKKAPAQCNNCDSSLPLYVSTGHSDSANVNSHHEERVLQEKTH